MSPLLEKRRAKNLDAKEKFSENSFDFEEKDEQQKWMGLVKLHWLDGYNYQSVGFLGG